MNDKKKGAERRKHERIDTQIEVDYGSGDTFLFSYITNISEMGIFIRSEDPLPIGKAIELKFTTHDGTALELRGEVAWINPVRLDGDNPNPGMGVRFVGLSKAARESIVELVKTVAYLPDPAAD